MSNAKQTAQALAAAGLNRNGVMAEVLMFLPAGFTDAYEALALAAYGQAVAGPQRRDGDTARAHVVNRERVTTARDGLTVGVGNGAGTRAAGSRVPLADERALRTKSWADRKLRALARDITARLSNTNAGARRCAGKCKQWADPDWLFCPSCGGPTEDV